MITVKVPKSDSYGALRTGLSYEDLAAEGFEYADFLTLKGKFGEAKASLVPSYRYLVPGYNGIIVGEDFKHALIMTYYGNFADKYGVSEGDEIEISLCEKQGYADEYAVRTLSRSNERSDYPKRTDEQYANFRTVGCGDMKKGVLYRSSSPIAPYIYRNVYADAAARKAGIKGFVNLSDTEEKGKRYPGYPDSYYSTQKAAFLCCDTNPVSDVFMGNVRKAVEFMTETEGPVLIHCIEGQDRTGFTVAVIESLMGADIDEIIDDYMLTFFNFYGIDSTMDSYAAISRNIVSLLEGAFGCGDLYKADLHGEALKYLLRTGLRAETVEALETKLGK